MEKSRTGKKPDINQKPAKKEFSRADYYAAYAEVVTPEVFKQVTKVMVKQAKKGDRELQKYIHDRYLGRPSDSLDVTSEGQAIAMQVYVPARRERDDS